MSQEGTSSAACWSWLAAGCSSGRRSEVLCRAAFPIPGVGALDPGSAAQAVEKPINDEDATIVREALNAIFNRTQGYPFFLQEWASVAWNNTHGPAIMFEDVDHSYAETSALIDEGFFRVRVDRLTKSEIQFVKTTSSLGDEPYAMADIARAMNRSLSSLGPSRADFMWRQD